MNLVDNLAHQLFGSTHMNIWKISIYSATGENRCEQPSSPGFVRADNIRQVSMFAHEAIDKAAQSVTIEIEMIAENSELAMLDPYTATWIS